ncbi:IS5 family transposase [Streptomyces xanthophaeus]
MQWARIEPLWPDRMPRRGGRWRDHRQVINAIAWKYRTGSPWEALQSELGSWKGAYNRLWKWAIDGTGERVFTALLAQADAEKNLNWAVAVDTTIIRAHQHPAGARSKGAHVRDPADHAPGRSRGRLTTKVHLAADGTGRPLAFVRSVGQDGDAPASEQVMTTIRVPRPHGQPRVRPALVLAAKAYPWRAIREHLRRQGIRACIPQPADHVASRTRGGYRGPPPAFGRRAYKQRNTVERCINRLQQRRGLATRYDRTVTIHLAGLHLAAILIWAVR